MHRRYIQRRYVVLSGGILSLVLVAATLFITVFQPMMKIHAAEPTNKSGSKYEFNQLKFGGGGFVTGMAIHPKAPGVMYVRTDVGGAYRLDANNTWTQLIVKSAVPNPTQSDYNVESIAVSKTNDRVLYVAAGGDGDPKTSTGRILKSTDRGKTFTNSSQRWFMSGNGDWRQGNERISVDPNNGDIVYFASRAQGLWVSKDAAKTWSQIPTTAIPVGSSGGSAPAGVTFAVFDPTSGTLDKKTKHIYAGVAGSGIYESKDAGITWTNILKSAEVPYTGTIAPDGTFYVGGSKTVERYTPSTNIWKNISPSTDGYFSVAVDPTNPQRLIVAPGAVGNQHIWRSLDQGSTWIALDIAVSSPEIPWIAKTDEINYMSASKIYFDPFVKDKLWFPQGTGVWYSKDNTGAKITWNFYSKGIEETVTTDIIAPPTGIPVVNIYDRQGAYYPNLRSYPDHTLIDNAFWGNTSLDYSGDNPSFLVTAQAKNNYYPSLAARGASSTDSGKTWNIFSGVPASGVGGNIAVASKDTKDIVWLPSTGDFSKGLDPYYSIDGGKTFQASTGLTSTKTHWLFWWGSKKALISDKAKDHTFYAITFDNGGAFYTSTDGGKTFVPAKNSPACSQDNDCHVYGQLHAAPGHAGHVWSSGAKDGLWYTTDAGATAWKKVAAVQQARSFGFGAVLPGYKYPAIYMYGEANHDTSFGVYRSPDQGATWTRISDAPLGIYDQVSAITGDMKVPGRVYVGFGGNGFAYGDPKRK